MARKRLQIFEAKNFAFVIGLAVFALCLLVQGTTPLRTLDNFVLDTHFNLRNVAGGSFIKSGTYQVEDNPNISPDIVIAGVNDYSLSKLGKWPWPRYRHADFLNSLARIGDQSQRENAVLLDFFFLEPSADPEYDAILQDAIKENGRVFQETILQPTPNDDYVAQEYLDRLAALGSRQGFIENVSGPVDQMDAFFGSQSPLQPLGAASAGFGHATFVPDFDKTFRRQALVAKLSTLTEKVDIGALQALPQADGRQFEHFVWFDRSGIDHPIPNTISPNGWQDLKRLIARESPPDQIDGQDHYVVYRVQDTFVPSITLALALHYFHRSVADVEVKLGQYIAIHGLQRYDGEDKTWKDYRILASPAEYGKDQKIVKAAEYRTLTDIKIPIDGKGSMLINFMGPGSSSEDPTQSTYPVRSYSAYAQRVQSANPADWPASLLLNNKIVMAGAFSEGMADDLKRTPFGMMYGIELHANALNTILMDKFITKVDGVWSALLVLVFCLLVAWYTARMAPPLSIGATAVLAIAFFLFTSFIFDAASLYFDFAVPIFAILFTMLFVIAYRVMTEQREKKVIQTMFGKFVSATVVDQMVAQGTQPELGGVDKELTVFFSDIRSFTTLSESMTPQELVNHLNCYLTAMTDIIMEFRGTLDKYVGDEVMCFWGAPLPEPDHAMLACRCALKQMEKLRELNEQWPPEKRINHGIGINTGIMTVGNMGSLGRMNYTLMGDNVNLGARLEGTNKEYGTNIIISEYTYSLVRDRVVARELDNIRVKGKNKPVLIYELVDVID